MLDTTYRPARHEADWLADSLFPFFEDGLLADVLFAVRSGKEADVYAVRGGPSTDGALLAAKVYRPAKHRHLRNDGIYRTGRDFLDGRGVAILETRQKRAIARGSRYGRRLKHQSWLMHEVTCLQRAWEAGIRVPRVWDWSENAIVMEFVGDEAGGAPTLRSVTPPPEVVARVAEELIRDLARLTSMHLVHGDLSAHNLLFWDDHAWWIDFPQANDLFQNPHAAELLDRDVRRLCTDLDRLGVRHDPELVWAAIWADVFDPE
jgi:RIO kinase 1